MSDGIATSALNPGGKETRQILDEAETQIFRIGEEGARGQHDTQRFDELLKTVVKRIDELASHPNPSDVTGVPSGFVDLDQKTAGMHGGDLIIVAGRPSMGKTSFALNLAEHVAIDQGLPIAIFSMEMGAEQLVLRMLCSVGRIDSQRLRTGRLLEDDWDRLTHAVKRLQGVQAYIDETPALNPLELRARARRMARMAGGLKLIVVDYIQLMSGASLASENRTTEISEITRSLKSLAKELNCPVIALSQLNRTVEQRTDKRPVMSDLRESGAIEQDADVILFIYRDEVYRPDTPDKGVADIIICKQRHGPIGVVRLTFLGQFTKFDNHAPPAPTGYGGGY